jgi:hypothetical protein
MTKAQLNWLRLNANNYTYDTLSEKLGVHQTTVRHHLMRMQVKKSRPDGWTDDEINKLVMLWPNNLTHEIAAILGRTHGAVRSQARALKLKRSPAYYVKKAKHCKARQGISTRFEKGQLPHNTIKGRVHYICQSTGPMYRAPGERSNWQPIKKLIWEHHNGPMPKSTILRMIDGNEWNLALENIICITRAEHVIINKMFAHLSIRKDGSHSEEGFLLALAAARHRILISSK